MLVLAQYAEQNDSRCQPEVTPVHIIRLLLILKEVAVVVPSLLIQDHVILRFQ